MYTFYFLVGFVTSFGWWTAGKVQKVVDNTSVHVQVVETKEVKKTE